MGYRPFIIPTVASVASVAAPHPKKDSLAPEPEAGLSPEKRARIGEALSQPTPPNVAEHVAARMAEETKQPPEWWEEPVAGWPEKIIITPLLTGKAITIKLRAKRKT